MARCRSDEQRTHELLACVEETPDDDDDVQEGGAAAGGSSTLRTRFLQAPLAMAHGDYTARSGRSRAEQLLRPFVRDPEVLATVLEERRFAIVNLWHPFKTVQADPLAMCTWGTTSPADVVTTRITFPTRVGETYKVIPNDRQKWVYFSRVTPEEAILLKVFDSKEDRGTARFTLHSAFALPPADPDPPARESMEVRILVLYAPEAAAAASKKGGQGCGDDDAFLARPFVPPHVQTTLASHTAGLIEQPLSTEDVPPNGTW